MKKIFVLFLLAIAATSCIPTKRITYLQEIKSNPGDSIVTVTRKVQAPYRLQINDILNINIRIPSDRIFEQKFSIQGGQQQQQQQQIGGADGQLFFNGYSIDLQGNIRIPQLGLIKAVGLTEAELREAIELELDKFISDPNAYFVTVKMDGLSYTLTGEVTSPGQFKVYRNQINIVEAISNGGGVPITGDLTNIRVIRQIPAGLKKIDFDLTDISILSSPDILLQQNDIIVVNPLPQKSLGFGTNGLTSFTTIATVVTTLISIFLIFNNN